MYILNQIGNMVEDLALFGISISDYDVRFISYVQFEITVEVCTIESDGVDARRLTVNGNTVSEIFYKNFEVVDTVVYDESAGDLIRDILEKQYKHFNDVVVYMYYND